MTSREKLALIKETWYDVDLTDEKYTYFNEEQTFNDLEKDLEELEQYRKAKELIEKMHKNDIYFKLDNGEIVSEDRHDSIIVYDFKNNEIYIYEYEYCSSYLIDEYGITWGFSEEELANNDK